jgi:hypothetical protein
MSVNTIMNKRKISMDLVLYLHNGTKGKYMHRRIDKFSSNILLMLKNSWLTSQPHKALPFDLLWMVPNAGYKYQPLSKICHDAGLVQSIVNLFRR